MYCTDCGAEMSAQDKFCTKCSTQAAAPGEREAADEGRRYSLWRVGILTLVSLGFYSLYWFGVSWKHLKRQLPGKDHYPVWHTLSLFVPFYNFVVIYQHFQAIEAVHRKVGLESNVRPGLVVALFIVGWVGGVATNYMSLGGYSAILEIFFYFVPPMASILWGQRALNRYWERRAHPEGARPAGTGPGEIIISAAGLIAVVALVFLIVVQSEAGSSMPFVLGSSRQETIENWLDWDYYSFEANAGEEYTIVVDPDSSNNDPLEDAFVTLTDANGEAVTHQLDTPIMITWTAQSSGTAIVDITGGWNDEEGDYTLRIDAAP